MTDLGGAPIAVQMQPPTPEERKAKRNATLTRWSSIVIGIAAVVIGLARLSGFLMHGAK